MRDSGGHKSKKLERYFSFLNNVMKNNVWAGIVLAYRFCYNFCYLIGAYTIRYFRIFAKKIIRGLKPAVRFLCRVADYIILRRLRGFANSVAAETRRFLQGFPLAGRLVKSSFKQGFASFLKTVFAVIPRRAVKRHRRSLSTICNLAAPAAAVMVLVMTINLWGGMTFALAVEYDGKKLGYITDESVYDTAANMVNDRVINTDNSFEVKRVPKLTIAVVSKSEIIDENAVCDKILENSNDSICQASGLYIDNKFECAVQSRQELDALLDSILKSYCKGGPNERAEFVQNVEIVDGLYPISSIVSIEETRAKLTEQTVVDKYYTIVKGDSPLLIAAKTDMSLEQLRALNPDFDKKIFPDVKVLIQKAQPYLRVQVVRTTEYKEAIPYKTVQVKDDRHYKGYTAVKTNGVNGEQRVKAEITYIDGIEQSRKILEKKVLKKPVDKVVIVGSKSIDNRITAAGDGISTGRFTWPLPSCRSISSPYGWRWRQFHAGIDISGNGVYGKPVVAADGGVVAEINTAGWGSGYGKYIIIDHGGGYRTVYAHLSAVNVRAGQKVSKGQFIGRVGNTGQSYGAHLHFEIRINGKSVNPVSYLR